MFDHFLQAKDENVRKKFEKQLFETSKPFYIFSVKLLVAFTTVLAILFIVDMLQRNEEEDPCEWQIDIAFRVWILLVLVLMILDNLILDVKKYEFHHPGGRFVMQRNLGRDISKYFYGGYTMMAGRQP